MSLPVEEQERALREAALAWHWRNNQRASKEQVAEELRYGSVEAVRRQFENWGIPSWVVGEESETNSTPSTEGKKSPPREPKPRDSKDAAQDIARDLADIAGQLASLKGKANSWLRDPNYNTLKLRLEAAHSTVEAAAVEARRRVRLNEG